MCFLCSEGMLYPLRSVLFSCRVSPPLSVPVLHGLLRERVAFPDACLMSASALSLLMTRSLSIPPFRLCGGNLEMLQGRALELDNICQEISIKDLCKRPWASPLSEFELPERERADCVRSDLPADDGASLCTARDFAGSQQRFCRGVFQRSRVVGVPQYRCSDVLARETLLPHRRFNTPHVEARRYLHPN